MRAKWPQAIAICCFALVVLVVYFCWWNPTTTILVVRHAERTDNSANTNLSPAGLARADALAEVVAEAGLSAIYSTDFCRTAQTAAPAASALGLTLNVQQSGQSSAGLGGCTPSISITTDTLPVSVNTPQDLADRILSQHRGGVVLVVGHSNTVPAIVAAVGQGSFSPIQIGSSEFDNLFVVTVRKYFVVRRLLKAQYGG